MQLTYVIAGIYGLSFIYATISGNLPALTGAAVEGAGAAAELCISLCGMLCLWSAVMELMSRSGLAEGLSRLLRPLLSRLFPSASGDRETMEALSENVSANLLGLGNAATPAGIRAAVGMKRLGKSGSASNELCLLVVMNTASIQLLPTTVASLRAAAGAASPMDILPAVWLSSLLSVTAGIAAAKLLERTGRHGLHR